MGPLWGMAEDGVGWVPWLSGVVLAGALSTRTLLLPMLIKVERSPAPCLPGSHTHVSREVSSTYVLVACQLLVSVVPPGGQASHQGERGNHPLLSPNQTDRTFL